MASTNHSNLDSYERLKEARQLKKWSQKQLAESLGIKQSNLSDIENGRRNLSNKMLEKVCVILHVSRDWMLTGKGDIFTQKDGSQVEESQVERDDFNMADFVDALIEYTEERRPTRNAKRLTDEQVNFELSYGIEQLKDVYTDNKLLLDSLPIIGASDWFLEKFQSIPEFSEWHKEIEAEFMNEHGHLSGKKLAILKIDKLYHPHIEHWRNMLSKLIFYIHQYGKLFRDSQKPPSNF